MHDFATRNDIPAVCGQLAIRVSYTELARSTCIIRHEQLIEKERGKD